MVLFEFNDVFARFTEAFQVKLGEPSMMTEEEYDEALKSIVRTDFYDTLARKDSGFDVLRWALTWGDKQVYLLLKDEKNSPNWVNQRKIKYMDATCDALGLPRFDFDVCHTDDEFRAHSWRGVLVTGTGKHMSIWEAAGNYRSIWHGDDAPTTIQGVKNFEHLNRVKLGLVPEDLLVDLTK